MAETITLRWVGAADAAAGSTYKIERCTDGSTWSTLAVNQAATAPYTPVSGQLGSNLTYGGDTISVANADSFNSSGYAVIEDALVSWTGKGAYSLTGVTWHSGFGTYITGTTIMQAHEGYSDSATPTLLAVLYRITHTKSGGLASPPLYIWYYYPPVPESNQHCVVIVNIMTDLGVEHQAGVGAQMYLASDEQFTKIGGEHLDAGKSAAKTQTTDAFGLAAFQCWKSSARAAPDGTSGKYTVVLNSSDAGKLSKTITTIPDRDWVLLKDIVDA